MTVCVIKDKGIKFITHRVAPVCIFLGLGKRGLFNTVYREKCVQAISWVRFCNVIFLVSGYIVRMSIIRRGMSSEWTYWSWQW